jgi:integrase/recombinase XerD
MPGNSEATIDQYLTTHDSKVGSTPEWGVALRSMLRRSVSYSEKDPSEWDTDEVMKITFKIRKSKDKQNYKRNLVTHLKSFSLWLAKTNKAIDIEEVKSIKVPDVVWKSKKPEDMLSPDEVTAVIKAAGSPRDRCLWAMLYDSSCRTKGIRELRWGDLNRDEYGIWFTAVEKTGIERRIRLTNISLPLLNEWENLCSDTSPDAYIFRPAQYGELPVNRPIGRNDLYQLACGIRQRTGIKKFKANIMRPTRITHDVKSGVSNAYIMKKNWGTLKTKMLDVYVHLDDEYMDQTALRHAGMTRVTEAKATENYNLEPPICPRCSSVNVVGSKWCSHCQGPLTKDAQATLAATKARAHADPMYAEMSAKIDQMAAELSELKKK